MGGGRGPTSRRARCVCAVHAFPQSRWGDAARKLAEVLNDDTFRSLEGKSKHSLWLELCDIITKHPREVQDIKVDAILRGGIRKFTDEVRRTRLVLRCETAPTALVHHLDVRRDAVRLDDRARARSTRAGGAAVDVAGRLLHPPRHV